MLQGAYCKRCLLTLFAVKNILKGKFAARMYGVLSVKNVMHNKIHHGEANNAVEKQSNIK